MADERPEPLDGKIWERELTRTQMLLSHDFDKITLSRALRRAFYLSQLSPDVFWITFASRVNEDFFYGLLDAGDLLGAARNLLAPDLDVSTSELEGKFIVVVRAAQMGGIGTGIMADHAAAILNGWVNCIHSCMITDEEAVGILNQDLHICPSRSHPMLN